MKLIISRKGLTKLGGLLTFVLLSCFSVKSNAQTIELSGGPAISRFYTINNDPVHVSSLYFPGTGFGITAGYNMKTADFLRTRITLSFDRYQSGVIMNYTGPSTEFMDSVYSVKSSLSVGFFPFYYSIFDHVDLGFGIIYTRLLKEKYTEWKQGWEATETSKVYFDNFIEDESTLYGTRNVFGIQGLLGYEIHLGERFSLVPAYQVYIGLSSETLDRYKSMRQYFSLAVKMDL